MSSQQRGATPTAAHADGAAQAGTLGHAGGEGGAGAAGTPSHADGAGGAGSGLREASDRRMLVRVLPLVLLIILGLVGLRGAVTAPQWDGPLHRDGLAVGCVLEVVLG